MDWHHKIIHFIDVNFIYCLVPIILELILIDFFLKNRFHTKKAFNGIRWFIVGYTIITVSLLLIMSVTNPNQYSFISFDRLKGPYYLPYIFMWISATLLPFILLNNKLASKKIILLLVAILMKAGFYMERFVITTTNHKRDYGDFSYSITENILLLFSQGLVIVFIYLFILKFINKPHIIKTKAN